MMGNQRVKCEGVGERWLSVLGRGDVGERCD